MEMGKAAKNRPQSFSSPSHALFKLPFSFYGRQPLQPSQLPSQPPQSFPPLPMAVFHASASTPKRNNPVAIEPRFSTIQVNISFLPISCSQLFGPAAFSAYWDAAADRKIQQSPQWLPWCPGYSRSPQTSSPADR